MTQPPADATVLALDLGGTQVRAALVRADGTRLGRAAAPTPVSDGPSAVVAACIATLQRARENATKEDAAAVSRLVGIGISAPGPLNPWTGVAVEPANLGPRFPGTDLAGPIGAALGLISIGLAIPLLVTYYYQGVVPRLPTAVLSTGLMVLASLSVACGLVLDTVTRGRRELKLLAYLAQRAPAEERRKS